MSKVACPECGHEFEVEVRVAAPVKPRRRWARLAVLAAALAAVAGCVWWALVR